MLSHISINNKIINEVQSNNKKREGLEKMSKILVFIYDDMADFEITFACQLLGGDMGKEIITIAYEDKTISGRSGMYYRPKKMIKDVLNEDVEGLIIPGGWNGEIRPELMLLIQNLHAKGKMLGAICAGPRFLAEAGVLGNVKYTTTITEWTKEDKERFGERDPFTRENYLSERVVRDGNIITAVGMAFTDFAVEIVDYFNGFDDQDDKTGFIKAVKGL